MVLVNCITFFFNRFRYGNLLREIPVSNSYRGGLSTNWCLTRFCYFSKTSGKLKSIDRGLETPLRSQHRPILAITDRVNEAQGTWLGFTARDTDTVMLDKCDSEG